MVVYMAKATENKDSNKVNQGVEFWTFSSKYIPPKTPHDMITAIWVAIPVNLRN